MPPILTVSFVREGPDGGLQATTIAEWEHPLGSQLQEFSDDVAGLVARVGFEPIPGIPAGRIDVEVRGSGRGYLAISLRGVGGQELWNFDGPVKQAERFRQSPHDPDQHFVDMAKQAVPMGALRTGSGLLALIGDTPAWHDNATTQRFEPADGWLELTNGDPGEMPGYVGVLKFGPKLHEFNEDQPLGLQAVLLDSRATELIGLRRDVFEAIARRWGPARTETAGDRGPFYGLCFASNYMHLRRNEKGHSDYWITPGIDYANKQYTRDAFWQMLVLPLEMQQQIYDAVYEERYKYAECGLLFLVWSHVIGVLGGKPDLTRARDALTYVNRNVEDGAYRTAPGHHPQHPYGFQSWYDLCCFEAGDVITYNQGLLAAGLLAAEQLGLVEDASAFERAREQYVGLYDEAGGFFPLSRMKRCLCVDAFAGDLLASVYFGRKLLPDEAVRQHKATLDQLARTEHGFKVTCSAEDGSYLPQSFYSATDDASEIGAKPGSEGSYQQGGSWYLYDMLMLLAAYVHGAAGAEDDVIWRTRIEIERFGTYHEHLNTATGQPGKPNQGWDAGIYGLWDELVRQGRAEDRFFRTIDRVMRPDA